MQYSLSVNGDHSNIVVFLPGEPEPLKTADSNHPNFNTIRAKVEADDYEGLADLFDPAFTIAQKFERVSDRVSVSGGHVYFDGDEVNNALTDQILRFLQEGVEDWKPLVAFWENLAQNPNEHSREHLFKWLTSTKGFTITDDGMVVAYKGVNVSQEGVYTSTRSGHAVVDGVPLNDFVPNSPGSVVEMPRSMVTFDPYEACSTGLHVGTYSYAKRFGSKVIEVHVNPRDWVSVPNHSYEKGRVCRYTVVNKIEVPHDSVLRPVEDITSAEQLV